MNYRGIIPYDNRSLLKSLRVSVDSAALTAIQARHEMGSAPYTRAVPKVKSNFFFLHAKWEQQTKESAVVDGTSCCVVIECLVTSIGCIT